MIYYYFANDAPEIDEQLTAYDVKLSLLLRIAETHAGAAAIVDAGIFFAIKISGIFAQDPDLGICECSIVPMSLNIN